MRTVRIDDISTLDDSLASLGTVPKSTFVLFFGTEDPATGLSWCPDCVDADPKIREAIHALPEALLILCPVGDRSKWKNRPEHPYRANPLIALSAIPTLFHWQPTTGFGQRLVEEECMNNAKLASFLAV
ncbi:hypothetical protein BDF19DRAFT_448749 [Syncephalis fuscata]|nr:hypothetical protein BDF19DRAFT_448749 [Syncephalis fuscata]